MQHEAELTRVKSSIPRNLPTQLNLQTLIKQTVSVNDKLISQLILALAERNLIEGRADNCLNCFQISDKIEYSLSWICNATFPKCSWRLSS